MTTGIRSLPVRLAAIVLMASLSFTGCKRGRGRALETAYVSAPQVNLRDRVAAVYTKQGMVRNGERVDILERERRFAKVRTAEGAEGWMEQRYLVTQQIYDGFQELAKQESNAPVQGMATARNETNLHIEPGRDTEHLYLISQGTKVSLLKRATAEKAMPGAPAKPAPKPTATTEDATKPQEDWWLVRDAGGHVGWLLARMLDADVPLEIAQYAEGQRIIAYFVLDEVADQDKKVPQYLMLLSEPKEGLPFDYNQARVFTWNVKRGRYETAYRERLGGFLPVTVSHENFDKEGDLPVFVLRTKDDSGNLIERKYKLNTPIVRRVLAPGEVAGHPSAAGRHPKTPKHQRRRN